MGSDDERPVRCGGVCECWPTLKVRTRNAGNFRLVSEHQVVCDYCGAAGTKELSADSAIQSWNSMWSPRFGDANPTTRLVVRLIERSPWRRVGWRSRIKACAYCPAWRVRGQEPEPHWSGCAWAEAKWALGPGVSDED